MLRLGRSCVSPQTVFQLNWYFRKTFLLTHKFGIAGLRLYSCNSVSPLRDACGSLRKRTHPPLEQYITWTRTTQCPTVQTHTPHCMQEDHACSEPVVIGVLRMVHGSSTDTSVLFCCYTPSSFLSLSSVLNFIILSCGCQLSPASFWASGTCGCPTFWDQRLFYLHWSVGRSPSLCCCAVYVVQSS